VAITQTDRTALPQALRLPSGILLAKLGKVAQGRFIDALQPTGLKPWHLVALFHLSQGPTTQQALVEAVGVDPSKLVGVLNDLEERGLVVRRRDPADRRRHIVEISAQGKTRLTAAKRAVAAAEEELFAGLDDRQRGELRSLLVHCADNVGLDCGEMSEADGQTADC
jgi:DNA-binding MarR family transcriptional regulator